MTRGHHCSDPLQCQTTDTLPGTLRAEDLPPPPPYRTHPHHLGVVRGTPDDNRSSLLLGPVAVPDD